jgi:hypothetical protein
MTRNKPSLLLIGILLITAILSACNSTGSQEDSIDEVRIGISPEAMPASDAVGLCARSVFGIQSRVTILQIAPALFPSSDLDIGIRLGETDLTFPFLTKLADEKIQLIVNSTNPIDALIIEQIRRLFNGSITSWTEINDRQENVELWIASDSDEARQIFISEILLGQVVTSMARVSASPDHMLSAVRDDPNAIALIASAWIDSSVHGLDIGLQIPLFAVTEQEADGQVREVLACLQNGTGQVLLEEIYGP